MKMSRFNIKNVLSTIQGAVLLAVHPFSANTTKTADLPSTPSPWREWQASRKCTFRSLPGVPGPHMPPESGSVDIGFGNIAEPDIANLGGMDKLEFF